MEANPYLAYYAQLLSVGLLWVTVHCAGMCGPLVAGLTAGRGLQGQSPRRRLWHSARGVLAYQGGRALTYLVLGASAGFAGAAMEGWIRGMTRIAGLVVAVGLIAAGIAKWPAVARHIKARQGGFDPARVSGAFIGRVMRTLSRRFRAPGSSRMFVFGLVLGLLPCMLMFWVLGLAASTASPFHGAMLMAGLVVLTTPVLLIAGCSTGLASGRLRALGGYLVPLAMALSGVWLGLIAMAANGWIAHVHLPFELGGHRLVVMLW
ncbi:MAG: sulfite exporter TauE/SafE family protein [Bradymonadaceae bacterium]|nr:sulfite exporter TauE/SafE family protein [Lujinxingiaceae bacterium]